MRCGGRRPTGASCGSVGVATTRGGSLAPPSPGSGPAWIAVAPPSPLRWSSPCRPCRLRAIGTRVCSRILTRRHLARQRTPPRASVRGPSSTGGTGNVNGDENGAAPGPGRGRGRGCRRSVGRSPRRWNRRHGERRLGAEGHQVQAAPAGGQGAVGESATWNRLRTCLRRASSASGLVGSRSRRLVRNGASEKYPNMML